MEILHLLSQNHLTGAEVYAVTLGQEQKRLGHDVHQISNDFFYPTSLFQTRMKVETKSRLRFILNVLRLRSYLKRNQIDLVHAHSRAASKLAFWSTLGTKTCYVSTVHGQQHSSFSKRLFNQYGQFIIAVCENIQNHLKQDFNYRPELIRIVRNPIDPQLFHLSSRVSQNNSSPGAQNKLQTGSRHTPARTLQIAIVGRTTGPKKDRTEQVLRSLFDLLPSLHSRFEITLIGGKLADVALPPHERELVRETQVERLSTEIYEKYDLVVGSGRVCMEALLSGTPTIAFGEAQYIGLVRNAHFNMALRSNFGDIDLNNKSGPRLQIKKFEEDLKSIVSNEITTTERRELSEKAYAEFATPSIEAKMRRIYQAALFLKKYPHSIPVLMYHKIPQQEIQSQHKIYVTKDNFEKHLQFFRRQGFETLTFSQLEKFKKQEIPFKEFPKKPLILTFDDGYRDNLENASPLLKKYGFNAQIFLLANPAIASNEWDASKTEPPHEIVSGSDRQRWVLSAFEIGSHGFSHKKITQMSPEDAFAELKNSKLALEKEFQTSINVYAFTYGDTNKEMPALAENAGYSYAVNTDSGGTLIEESPYEIFRTNIFPNEDSWSLFKKTSRWYRRYYRWKRKK